MCACVFCNRPYFRDIACPCPGVAGRHTRQTQPEHEADCTIVCPFPHQRESSPQCLVLMLNTKVVGLGGPPLLAKLIHRSISAQWMVFEPMAPFPHQTRFRMLKPNGATPIHGKVLRKVWVRDYRPEICTRVSTTPQMFVSLLFQGNKLGLVQRDTQATPKKSTFFVASSSPHTGNGAERFARTRRPRKALEGCEVNETLPWDLSVSEASGAQLLKNCRAGKWWLGKLRDWQRSLTKSDAIDSLLR